MPVMSRELFVDMMKALDKDGDGQVDKGEFKSAYVKTYSTRGTSVTDADYDKVWAKIDIDGSGDLSIEELTKFFGFDNDKETSEDMSEDQILAALSMQSHLFDEVMHSFQTVHVDKQVGRRRASVLAQRMPKPIGPKQMRQYLGLKTVRVPISVSFNDELDAAMSLL